jgi:large subunit ribosomal protein L15
MITLSALKNSHRPMKKVRRVGRGTGCKRGKTCGRGGKGDSARAGYKKHYGNEGGQMRLYRKLPVRGFTRGLHLRPVVAINLGQIEELYSDGEVVNLKTLREKGFAPRTAPGGIKILGDGELKKKVSIEAHHFSKMAKAKLEKSPASFSVIGET